MNSNPISTAHTSDRSQFVRRARGACRAGFTMVEMLTVIGIIVILMAILLPVVSRVRIQVRVAQTQQEMNKIAGAIDQYYLEFNHAYPGPLSNVNVNPSNQTIIPNLNGGSGIVIPTQTENLVLGLCGGLELNGSTSPQYNSNDIQSSLGPLNMNPNPIKQTRHVAFIDATPGTQMQDLPWDGGNGTLQGDSDIPEFMDKFNSYNGGRPRAILYLRARVGNPANSGTTAVAQISAGNDSSNQYNYMHLQPYADPTFGDFYQFIGSNASTVDTADQFVPLGSTTPNPTWNPNAAAYWVQPSTASTVWDSYLGNPNQFTSPRGVNAYILISAGPDGIFGTQDDLFYP